MIVDDDDSIRRAVRAADEVILASPVETFASAEEFLGSERLGEGHPGLILDVQYAGYGTGSNCSSVWVASNHAIPINLHHGFLPMIGRAFRR